MPITQFEKLNQASRYVSLMLNVESEDRAPIDMSTLLESAAQLYGVEIELLYRHASIMVYLANRPDFLNVEVPSPRSHNPHLGNINNDKEFLLPEYKGIGRI